MNFEKGWAGAALLAAALPCGALEPSPEILVRDGDHASCRKASPGEEAALRAHRGDAPVHVLARSRQSLAASAGLHVVLRGTAQLEAHADAKAAFLRAAERWESLVTSPITIVLDVDYGDTFFGDPFPSPSVEGLTQPQYARFPWPAVRAALLASADTPARQTLHSALPVASIPSDRGAINAIHAPAPLFRALGLLSDVEDPDAEGTLGAPARIGFRAFEDYWDLDPTDGVALYAGDFDAVVMHEIGHALGFVSDIGGSGQPVVSLLDVYRFRPSATPPDLGTTPRVATSGGEQVFFAGGAQLPLSTRGLDNLGSDSQASHWKSEWLAGLPIGVMDPGAYWFGRIVVTSRDLAAFEAMGLKTVGVPPPEPSIRTIPIVLDAAGVGNARFSTELTLANRSIGAADVTLTYTAANAFGGVGSGSATTPLPALHQLLIPDALQWLRDHGVPVPSSGNQGGTLTVTFRGDDSRNFFYAGARTTSPAGSGRAGLAYPAIRQFNELRGRSYVYGLRENATDRSNLALLNVGTTPVTLRVTLHPGSGGTPVTLADVALDAGQWTQLSRVLAGPGFSSAWATIDLVGAAGLYGAYGVFNDNVSNDGSFAPAVPDPLQPETQYVPVIVETSTFSSELVLANPSATAVTATVTYTESLSPAAGAGGKAVLPLAAGEQVILPSAVDWLRSHGAAIGAKGAGSYAGLVAVDYAGDPGPAIGLAGARTSAPSAAGAFGLFTPGVTYYDTDIWYTWVFGLRQDSASRSNLAVINVGDGKADLTLHVEIYDGDTGTLAGTIAPFTLPPGGWRQFDAVLSTFGVRNGFARVVYDSGSGSILAYGVVNDGPTPSSGGTNDGSYVPSSKL